MGWNTINYTILGGVKMKGLNYTLNHGSVVIFYPLLEHDGKFWNVQMDNRNSWHRSVYVSKRELNTNSLCSRSSYNSKHNSGKQLNNCTRYKRAKCRKFRYGSGPQTPLLLYSSFVHHHLQQQQRLTTEVCLDFIKPVIKRKFKFYGCSRRIGCKHICLRLCYLKQYQTLNQK
jgi:hypothetical protein